MRAGAAAWVIQDGDARIVVDPAQAADEILRTDDDAAVHQEAFAALLEAAGMPRESFTHAISTHLDGIGMWAWRNDDGSWVPFFPNAPILMSQRELDAIDRGRASVAGPSRVRRNCARSASCSAVADDERVTDARLARARRRAHARSPVRARRTPGGEQAVMVGHLAVTPLHLVTGPCPQQHPEPDEAQAAHRRAAHRGRDAHRPVVARAGRRPLERRALVPVTASATRRGQRSEPVVAEHRHPLLTRARPEHVVVRRTSPIGAAGAGEYMWPG